MDSKNLKDQVMRWFETFREDLRKAEIRDGGNRHGDQPDDHRDLAAPPPLWDTDAGDL